MTFFLTLYRFFLINTFTVLVMWAKLSYPGLLKIKIFQNKGYHVTFLDFDVTNKILPRDSNYIVDLVIWTKFGNSSRKNNFFQCGKKGQKVLWARFYVDRSYRKKLVGGGVFLPYPPPIWIGLTHGLNSVNEWYALNTRWYFK